MVTLSDGNTVEERVLDYIKGYIAGTGSKVLINTFENVSIEELPIESILWLFKKFSEEDVEKLKKSL